ncbi:hypothetical protein RND71_021180 [Anisodus tanguticus]|uniref:Uncharacterized protein n=1 Tax=Anisodus tanguticus TaxID=243964 RepID=A0AAE1RW23_9SOLA|nr:hypothetical protein RND71_021180 [Anisodus tanguticus]
MESVLVKVQLNDGYKLERLNGLNYKCWSLKMEYLLTIAKNEQFKTVLATVLKAISYGDFLSSDLWRLRSKVGGALQNRRRSRGSVRGGASGFQCTASKIRMSLPDCRPILE